MDFIVLKGNTHDKEELAPVTGLTSGLEATAAGSNPFSTGYVEITDADGQTQKVATLTTDVVNFRYINNQIQMTVRKLMGKEVKESYILPLTIPSIPQYNNLTVSPATPNVTAQVERNMQTREQKVYIRGAPFPSGTPLTVNYSTFAFSGEDTAILHEAYGMNIGVNLKSKTQVRFQPGATGNGMLVLRGVF